MAEQRIKVLTVTDLHQDIGLIDQLKDAVLRHHPDLLAFVGDFLDGYEQTPGKYTVQECARLWSDLPVKEILFTKGNHDHEKLEEIKYHWHGRPLNILEADVFTFGPLQILCFPCIMGDFSDNVLVNANPELWFPGIVRKYGSGSRSLWLMHEPPLGTALSRPEGVLAGHAKWMDMVERFQPRVVLFGHDHETPLRRKLWNVRLANGSLCIALGQDSKLRYSVLEYSFADDKLLSIHASAYPIGERLQVLP